MSAVRNFYELAKSSDQEQSKLGFDLLKLYVQAKPEDKEASAYYCECVTTGYGTDKDPEKGFELAERCAANGSLHWQLVMANHYRMYRTDAAFKANLEKALDYCSALLQHPSFEARAFGCIEAIVHEHPSHERAKLLYGECFIQGRGVGKNVDQGRAIYKEASSFSNEAAYRYALSYINDNDVKAASHLLVLAGIPYQPAIQKIKELRDQKLGVYVAAYADYLIETNSLELLLQLYKSLRYEKILGNSQDIFDVLKNAASRYEKNAELQYLVGVYSYYGSFCKKDLDLALSYQLRAVALNSNNSNYCIAHIYFDRNDFKNAGKYYYEYLKGRPVDYTEYADCVTTAFDRLQEMSKSLVCTFELGACHYYGYGTVVNYVQAYAVFGTTVDPRAQYHMGVMLEEGRGLGKSLDLAMFYYKNCLEARSAASETADLALKRLLLLARNPANKKTVLPCLAAYYEKIDVDPLRSAMYYAQYAMVLFEGLKKSICIYYPELIKYREIQAQVFQQDILYLSKRPESAITNEVISKYQNLIRQCKDACHIERDQILESDLQRHLEIAQHYYNFIECEKIISAFFESINRIFRDLEAEIGNTKWGGLFNTKPSSADEIMSKIKGCKATFEHTLSTFNDIGAIFLSKGFDPAKTFYYKWHLVISNNHAFKLDQPNPNPSPRP